MVVGVRGRYAMKWSVRLLLSACDNVIAAALVPLAIAAEEVCEEKVEAGETL